ncbi:MAG: VanZ family protein [Planctomycetota bacterium]|jgi:VanZ family protein
MKNRPAAVIAFVALLVLVFVIPVPKGGRVVNAAGDVLHALLFAGLAVLLYHLVGEKARLSVFSTMLVCWALVVGFGVATEAMQSLVGRNTSWHDVWTDAFGGGAGILWARSRGVASRAVWWGVLAGGCAVFLVAVAHPLLVLTDSALQRLEMPRLASFEHPLELSRWVWRDCQLQRTRRRATHGRWALRMDLKPGRYPGVSLIHPVPDWSGFRTLVIDAHVTHGPPLDLAVTIKDREHNKEYYDRFNRTIRLPPGDHQIRIALREVANAPRGREMDLREVAILSLFTVSLDSPRTLYLDNIRLE